jgi:tripeptidyl-peptidase-1
VTAVGGTESLAPEIAWRDSSGGFSTYFGRPWYQEVAVKTFLEKVLPKSVKEYFKSYFRVDGRAFPDISAHSLYPAYTVSVTTSTARPICILTRA